MQHSIQCFTYVENMQAGKLSATINLKINLAEVWDFYLEFSDWKTSSLKDKDRPGTDVSSYMTIEMPDGGPGTVINPIVTSEKEYNNFNPYWKKFADGIKFRGTYHQLKA
jgi:hypothetical protein